MTTKGYVTAISRLQLDGWRRRPTGGLSQQDARHS
jgi:hypothetical protein